MSQLLLKGMLDKRQLQLHHQKLADEYMDILLLSIVGLKGNLEGVKAKDLYRVLSCDIPAVEE